MKILKKIIAGLILVIALVFCGIGILVCGVGIVGAAVALWAKINVVIVSVIIILLFFGFWVFIVPWAWNKIAK